MPKLHNLTCTFGDVFCEIIDLFCCIISLMEEFKLKGEYIQLIQLLKVLNWVEHGAMAQYVVEEGMVKYNGQIDYRKRLKVRRGDEIEFDSRQVRIV